VRTRHLALILAIALSSHCRVVRGPAGFWKAYHPEFISAKYSDQGPWGGERSITWHSPGRGTFTFARARAFAEDHGWKLLGQASYVPRNAGKNPTQETPSHAPKFLGTPSVVGRFDSGWIREDPGTSEVTPALGYVQVSEDGSEMYVHHFWGNG
jgi:hypothetical protein